MNYNLNSQRKKKEKKKINRTKRNRTEETEETEFREAHNAVSLDSPLTSSHRESIHLVFLEIGDDIDDRPCFMHIEDPVYRFLHLLLHIANSYLNYTPKTDKTLHIHGCIFGFHICILTFHDVGSCYTSAYTRTY